MKISVIIPVYNVEKYLHQCVDSVLGQTYQDIEVILVDDGSTDGCPAICDEYARMDSRVRVLHIKNSGVAVARNMGLTAVSGEYLLFVDGDDWIELSTCQKAVTQVVNESVDLVMWPYLREFPNRSSPKKVFEQSTHFDEIECQKLMRRMIGLVGNELAHPENADVLSTVWGKLYRSDLVRNNKIEFTDLNRIGSFEDGLFNLRYMCYVKKAIYIPDCLSHYRKCTGMTSKHRENLPERWSNLFADIRKIIRDNDLDDTYIRALNNRISLSMIGLGLNAVLLPNRRALCEIRSCLFNQEYREAIKTLPLEFFPIHWWVFFFCCKINFSVGVFLLLKCMERMKE